MGLILIGHSRVPFLRIPVANPEVVELQTNSFTFPLDVSLSIHVISPFLAIGGMVQAVSFLVQIEKSIGKVDLAFAVRKILRRLARFLLAYAFVIFYQATLFPRTKLTPIGYKFAEHCDRHWWTNLLFINNYVHADEPCLKFGWYLGAEFQLFLISLVIMMVIWRFPRTKMPCIYLMVAISLAAPAFVIYYEKLEATQIFNMKHMVDDDYLKYDEFLKNYYPTSVNAGYYFFGMISGLAYYHISTNKLHFKAIPLTARLLPSVLLIFLIVNGALTVLPSLPKPSLELSIFGSALKAIWGISSGTMLLYFALRTKSKVVAFLAHPKMQVLARLSYCIYIVQFSVVCMVYSNLTVPATFNTPNMVLITSVIWIISSVSGLLLCLAVQLPCNVLLDRFNKWMFCETKPQQLRGTELKSQTNIPESMNNVGAKVDGSTVDSITV